MDNKHNSLNLTAKICSDICPWTLSVPRSSQRKTVRFLEQNARGQISEHIFALNEGYCLYIREFKKLRRQLQRKRLIKIELCVKLTLLRLFHVDHVVQNTRIALSLAWYERFSCKGRVKDLLLRARVVVRTSNTKISSCLWQTTSKHCTKKRAARAALLFFLIQPIKSLNCDDMVDVAVVKS